MRHKIAMTCMLGMLLLGVAGCGEMKVEEYTQAGMNEIQNYNYDAAMESFDRAEELKEDPMLIARGRGIASYYLMDYDSSVAYYLQSLSYSDSKADKLDFDTNFYLADAYEKLDDHQSAVDTYTAILNLHEKDVTAYYLRGIQYLLLGNHSCNSKYDLCHNLKVSSLFLLIDFVITELPLLNSYSLKVCQLFQF